MVIMIEHKAKPLRQCTDTVLSKYLSGMRERALSRAVYSWDLDLWPCRPL